MLKSEIKKLDKLWSDKIKTFGRCQTCGTTTKKLEAAHIVGRSFRTTRWGAWINGKYDLNGLCLCFSCHQGFDQHMSIEKYIRENIIGTDRFNALLTVQETIAKHQDFDTIKKDILKNG